MADGTAPPELSSAQAVTAALFRILGPLAPGLMARWGHWLWRRTRRFPLSNSERRLLARAERQWLNTDAGRVRLYSWGQGPAVLLVHGWNSRASRMGALVTTLSRAGYRVLAMDAPGHGDSPGRSSSVLAVSAALQAVGRDQGPFAAAVTHSFGCACLLHAMSQGLTFSSDARIACISPPNRVETLLARFAQALSMPPVVHQAMVAQLEARYGAGFWRQVAPDVLVLELTLPGLVIHDRDDRQVPWRHAEAIAKAWPGAELVLTEGLGHNRILYHRQTLQRLRRFITD